MLLAVLKVTEESSNPGNLAFMPHRTLCFVWDLSRLCSVVRGAWFSISTRTHEKKDVEILATWKVVCMPLNLYSYSISRLL